MNAAADTVRTVAYASNDVIVVLPHERHLGRGRRSRATKECHVITVKCDLSFGLLQYVRLWKIVAREALVRDLGDATSLQIFRMCATGLAASDLCLVDPLGEPFEVAVAKEGIAVDLNGVKLRQVRKRVLLDRGNDVVREVELLQGGESDEGLVTDGLDLVPG